MRRALDVIQKLALVGAGAGAAATAAGFFGGAWWIFDLVAHFRLQLLGGLLVCAAILASWRWWAAAGAAGFGLMNAIVIAPLWLGEPAPADPESPTLELTLFNVHVSNPAIAELAAYLAATDSDVIAALEVDRDLLPALEAALPGYRAIAEPRPDSFGVAVFSRLPGEGRVIELIPGGLPAIELVVTVGGRPIDLLVVHPLPPVGRDNTARRDRLLEAAGRWVDGRDNPAVVIGDLNATPFSSAFRQLRGDRLVSSQRGFGYQATWSPPLPLLSVPIDHCLHDPRLTTIERRVGPALGSDHRPLHVSLAWRRSP